MAFVIEDDWLVKHISFDKLLLIFLAVLGFRAAALATFKKLWKQLCPRIVCCRPMTDLCWECQKNNNLINRTVNCEEEKKTATLQRQEAHLQHVKEERTLYKKQVADARVVVADGSLKLGRNDPCSRECVMHYSFDFAQQIHYPSNPLQPGPMYFVDLRKCGIFGVCCEGVPQQVNYLIDEGMTSTKGSNAVISYLHHFFENYGLGEEHLSLHCDNCSGQNKNRYKRKCLLTFPNLKCGLYAELLNLELLYTLLKALLLSWRGCVTFHLVFALCLCCPYCAYQGPISQRSKIDRNCKSIVVA